MKDKFKDSSMIANLLGFVPVPPEVFWPASEVPVAVRRFDRGTKAFTIFLEAKGVVEKAQAQALKEMGSSWVFVSSDSWGKFKNYFVENALLASRSTDLKLERRIYLLIEAGYVLLQSVVERPAASRRLADLEILALDLLDIVEGNREAFNYAASLMRDEYTVEGHCLNVGILTAGLANSMTNVDRRTRVATVLSALLHDLGKTRLPGGLLDRKGELAKHEWDLVRMHPIWTGKMLGNWQELDPLVPLIASQHHEKPDGSGYPYGLAGRDIHPGALIVGVADVYDAMTSRRPYGAMWRSFDAIRTMWQEGVVDQGLMKELVLLLGEK